MCAKNHLLIFSSFLDIWENVEWRRFFGPPCRRATDAYCRTVLGERAVFSGGGLQPTGHLSAQAGDGWSASDTHATMSSGLCDLWPTHQRSLRHLSSTLWGLKVLPHSQENVRRQNRQKHLRRNATYVCVLQCRNYRHFNKIIIYHPLPLAMPV